MIDKYDNIFSFKQMVSNLRCFALPRFYSYLVRSLRRSRLPSSSIWLLDLQAGSMFFWSSRSGLCAPFRTLPRWSRAVLASSSSLRVLECLVAGRLDRRAPFVWKSSSFRSEWKQALEPKNNKQKIKLLILTSF